MEHESEADTVNDDDEVDLFYEKARWRRGTLVTDTEYPELRGVLVRRVATFWADRDSKPPMVRWDGKIDAVEIPWKRLVRR